MQVSNALNNNIRILFNPKVEAFKLFDFLIAKSGDDRYLAQIIEIYDDKFDASQNVAKLKLFYKISADNEVIPYDNFTPSKECEIIKINQNEVENFINQDKKTFEIGINVKDSTPLNIQYAFFANNPLILADKIETANAISLNLAKNLSNDKHTVIIDTTGVIEYNDAKKVKFGKNFKLPLNTQTIDYIFDKCLGDSTLEFQITGAEILNEIKKFAKKQPDEFIPFSAFANVLMEQYKATPYSELKLLIERLKKYQMNEIFARSKKDIENPFKTIADDSVTIVDISLLNSFWQKAYIDYFFNEINTDCYIMTRLNDEIFDVDLINKIYNTKNNINFVPNVSYNYKKLPSLIQYCKNYVLMPSLYQRSDFLDANFALCNLISEGCILFGQNTDNFLYLVKDYELKIEERRKSYRKISLTNLENIPNLDMPDNEDNFINQAGYSRQTQQNNESQDKILQELNNFQNQQTLTQEIQNQEEIITSQNPDIINTENIEDISLEDFENEAKQIEALNDSDVAPVIEEVSTIEAIEAIDTNFNDAMIDPDEPILQNGQNPQDIIEISTESQILNKEDTLIEQEVPKEEISQFEETKENIKEEIKENIEEKHEEENIGLSDEELDFFEPEKESVTTQENENNSSQDDIDLSEVANNSINNNFEDIISKSNIEKPEGIMVDENTTISLNVNNTQKHEDLPIFNENEIQNISQNTSLGNSQTYNVNDIVIHKKYGKGTIIKTIKYENRQLLQIEFEDTGKKLLDPKVADIKPAQ